MTKELQAVLSSDYSYRDFCEVFLEPLEQQVEAKPIPKTSDLKSFEPIIKNNDAIVSFIKKVNYSRFGKILQFDIYDVTIKNTADIRKNRHIFHTLVKQKSFQSKAAFLLIHYETPTNRAWRFSLVTKEETTPKRYTYVFGKGHATRTAVKQLTTLLTSFKKSSTSKDLADAFAIEPLTEEFYKGRGSGLPTGMKKEENNYTFLDWEKFYLKRYPDFGYYQWYQLFQSYVIENKNNLEMFGQYFADCDDKDIRNYIKKLFGRIVFLFFLQKKGWLGCKPLLGKSTTDWTSGNRNFMHDLIQTYMENPRNYTYICESQKRQGFLDAVLEPLFFECLNENRTNDIFAPRDNIIFNTGKFKGLRFPYLNGGLFKKDDIDPPCSRFPDEYFKRLFAFFDEYNFTIDENSTDDIEIGVDPEMLGKIFEGLLEDNKDNGAYYTPKPIVEYICRESLIAYLETHAPSHSKDIRALVENHVLPEDFNEELKDIWLDKLTYVKVCDPAIGSGAFPMGMLTQILQCRKTLGETDSNYELKKHIIEKNIYGVDIDPGAVDIARLRFWLSMVVDADKPEPLPNLDFKIMQGNSLIESYGNTDLREIASEMKQKDHQREFNFDGLSHANILQSLVNKYYSQFDHAERDDYRVQIRDEVNALLEAYHCDPTNLPDPLGNKDFFLWHTWFKSVFDQGGFDIVIGNPPYGVDINNAFIKRYYVSIGGKERSEITGIPCSDRTKLCGSKDSYVLFIEQGIKLLKNSKASLTYIVPMSVTSSDSVTALHAYLESLSDLIRIASFSDRPVQLFANADSPVSIIHIQKSTNPKQNILTTGTLRRLLGQRIDDVIKQIFFINANHLVLPGRIPRIGNIEERSILSKVFFTKMNIRNYISTSNNGIYYRKAGGRYFKVVTPYSTGSTQESFLPCKYPKIIGLILSSSLFYFYLQVYSDLRHIKDSEIMAFGIPDLDQIDKTTIHNITTLYNEYCADIEKNAVTKKSSSTSSYKVSEFKEYKIVKSLHIIKRIDDAVGKLYGLTDEEIEYIKQYEMDTRMNGDKKGVK